MASVSLLLMASLTFSQAALTSDTLPASALSPRLFDRLLSLIDQVVGVVLRVDGFLLLLVFCLMSLGFIDHAVDVFLAHAAVRLDRDLLLFARAEVLSGDVHDAIGINIEGNFDLRYSTRSWRDIREPRSGRASCCRQPSHARPAGRGYRRTAGYRQPSRKSGSCASGSSYCAR